MGPLSKDDRRFLVAYSGQMAVARVGVKRHRGRLHFGFFECLRGHQQSGVALLKHAHRFAAELPMVGPFNFRMEDPYTGLLVEGFEHRPSFLVAYNPGYYQDILEEAGFVGTVDLNSYHGTWTDLRQTRIERRCRLAREAGLSVRRLSRRRRLRDFKQVVGVMNQALAENWGFEEFSGSHVWELTAASFLLLDPDWMLLVEQQHRMVGAAIVLPDYNLWLEQAAGRVSPQLLWRLLTQKKTLTRVRGWAFGVLPEVRALHAGPLLFNALLQQGHRAGVEEVEVSWVLAQNTGMNAMLRALGGRLVKVHRLFRREPRG